MRAVLRSITWMAEHASGALLLLATFMMFTMAITRYVFAWSDPSIEILSRYLMIWATFVGVAGAVRADSDIRFTLIEALFPPRGRRIFRTIGIIVAVTLVVGLAVSGVSLVEETHTFNEVMPTTLRWPIWIFHLAVPVGAGLLGLQLVAKAISLWQGGDKSLAAPPDAHY
jgi:C4-dicarboxylate transporter DctQ subunit